jgi:glycosyltransferase involved in cell wall biosynthesis
MPDRSRDVLVVVPTRGERLSYLELSVRSLLAQTLQPRILVITGGQPEPLRARWADLPGIKVVAQQTKGLSRAINEAWEIDGWTSEFTAWLGDDDALPPWSLSEAVGVLDAHPTASAVHGPCLVVDGTGAPVRVYRNGRWASWLAGYGVNLLPQPGSLFRSRAVEAVGGLDTELRLAMDVDLFIRLRAQGPIVSARRQLGVFREHADGLSTAHDAGARQESTASMRRAHTDAIDPLRHLLAAPLSRSVALLNRSRPPSAATYWRPSSSR